MLQLDAFKRLCVILVICCFANVAAGQNLRESARHHAARYPGESLPLVGPLGDYWPKPIEEVAREAVVVVRARLALINSYLSASEDRDIRDHCRSVTPLLKNADQIFKGTVNERVDDFIARIRAAVQHP